MIETASSGHMQAVTSSAPRRITIALALALAACEDEGSQCDATPEFGGAATFEGGAHTFDHGYATIYMAGPREDPCVTMVSVTAKGEEGAIEVFVSAPEDGGPLAVSGVYFGGPFSPGDYGLWNEDNSKFSATFEIDERSDDCARASLTVTGTNGRMYLSASEDWGPYMLKDVNLTVTGTFPIEWSDEACE